VRLAIQGRQGEHKGNEYTKVSRTHPVFFLPFIATQFLARARALPCPCVTLRSRWCLPFSLFLTVCSAASPVRVGRSHPGVSRWRDPMTKTAVGHQGEALAREQLWAQAAFALSCGRACANLRVFATNPRTTVCGPVQLGIQLALH
jgi:hypothetical protein